ncbi:hypothetical protein E2C01_054624 [Portunus trituberculatus]|uniref:Uncharacterized protein n=1 Tax=Portunus trituberculatus TaxID=210409 RepID=A0A5B7GP55_PORTR|nr:hypothetical protein [Portunus trituberculatus]
MFGWRETDAGRKDTGLHTCILPLLTHPRLPAQPAHLAPSDLQRLATTQGRFLLTRRHIQKRFLLS